jgi:hypothetical protein
MFYSHQRLNEIWKDNTVPYYTPKEIHPTMYQIDMAKRIISENAEHSTWAVHPQ